MPFWLSLFVPFIILLPKLNLFGVGGVSVGVRIEDFIILLLALYLALDILVRRQVGKLWAIPAVKAWIVWLGWSLLSTIIGYLFLDTVTTFHLGALFIGRYVEFFCIFLVAMRIPWTEVRIKRFLGLCLAATIAVWVYAVLQVWDLVPYFSTLQSIRHRGAVTFDKTGVVMGTFGGHYDFGIFTVVGIAFLLAFLIRWFRVGNPFSLRAFWGLRGALVLALILGAVCLLLTSSRSGYLALLAALLLIGWRYQSRWVSYLTLASGMYLVTRFLTGSLGNNPRVVNWFGLTVYVDLSLLQRLGKWTSIVTDASPITWLIGAGISSQGSAVDGYYIRLIGEVGVIGLVLFVLLIWQLLMTLRLLVKDANMPFWASVFARGMLLGLVALLTQAIFIDTFVSSKVMLVFWFGAGVITQLAQTAGKPSSTSV